MEFNCKQFSLNHTKSSMKIGTDAILLSALTNIKNPNNILDIGTGCGIIALCMAQKYQYAKITAIDIDRNSIEEAKENFKKSKYSSQLTAKEIDINTYSKTQEEKYDLIITNPPYFISSLESSNEKRNKARHTKSLNFQDLIQSTENLLSQEGILSLILPTKESQIFEQMAKEKYFQTIYKANIYSKIDKQCERVVLHLQRKQENNSITNKHIIIPSEETIILRNPDNSLTDNYKNLVNEYLI